LYWKKVIIYVGRISQASEFELNYFIIIVGLCHQ